jgi:D-glycero-alpha-D-manno-heptose 1-phosphate guanylyltransferase
MEAIILAGGFGERLQSKVKNIPKPMAPINNRPFLDYLLDYLVKNKIKKVIFSVYYKYELIRDHYNNNYKKIKISYSIDSEPLGTGGAIKCALNLANDENIFVINGDTFFDVNLLNLYNKHINNNNDITFSVKPMNNFDRYGIVETNKNGQVISFKEKKYRHYGQIDGGVYLVNKSIINSFGNRVKFSFNDFIMKNINNLKIGSILCDKVFIDIGTPEDYLKAHRLLGNATL